MLDLDKPILKVSQVAKEINVSCDRLRTYDEENLIIPTRKNKVRLYSYNDVEWLLDLRKLIAKNSLSVSGFKEILRITYFLSDEDFENFVQKQPKNSIWKTVLNMRKNPNYKKLKNIYSWMFFLYNLFNRSLYGFKFWILMKYTKK